jgi:hypothetical protein
MGIKHRKTGKTVISQEGAEQFISAMKVLLSSLDQERLQDIYLFDQDSKSVVISFTAQWKPFIGSRLGLNPDHMRIYIPEKLRVIQKFIEALKKHTIDPSGGRIFISKKYLRRKTGDSFKLIEQLVWKHAYPYRDLYDYSSGLQE